VNLKIRGVDFITNIIVLESKGIDVTLGMDWLGKHKVLIDYAKKSVKLTTLDGKDLEFVAEPVDEDINTSATIIPSIEILGPITRS
jgi:hypothetical protein